MRVLFAIAKGEVGGAQEHVALLSRGLLERGWEVGLAVDAASPLAERLQDEGVEIFDWPGLVSSPRPLQDWKARGQLAGYVEKFAPDVLHLHTTKAGVLGRGLPGSDRRITVFTCHHAAFGPGRKMSHRLLARPVEQLSLSCLDGVLTVGARDVPLLAKLARGVPVFTVPNAVPVSTAPISPAVPTCSVLWVARLAYPKEPLLAVDAWRHVVARIPHAELHICGTGPLAGRVRKRVAASPAREQITVHGFVPDLSELQSRCSIFLLATRAEGGCTMATLEAMSQGLVPVVSDAGDAFLYTLERCGVVVAPRSARALADGVLRLCEDQEELIEIRDRAIGFARSRSSTAIMAERTQEIYASLLARKKSTSPSFVLSPFSLSHARKVPARAMTPPVDTDVEGQKAGRAEGELRRGSVQLLKREGLRCFQFVNRHAKSGAVRLTHWTGKNPIPIHPKHLVGREGGQWYEELLRPNQEVLDLGCSQGAHARIAQSLDCRVFGADRSEKDLRHAVSTIPVICADFENKLPFSDNSVDVILLIDVLEHIFLRQELLDECSRLLRPDGSLLLTLPNAETRWRRLLRSYDLPSEIDPDHKIEYSFEEAIAEVEKGGFNVKKVCTITYDTAFAGLIDIIGGLSLCAYELLARRWKQHMVESRPQDTTGWCFYAVPR